MNERDVDATILVVDDEPVIRKPLRDRLTHEGMRVYEAGSVDEAQSLLASRAFDVALFDLVLPDGDGLQLLQAGQRLQPGLTSLIITGHSTVETAVAAMREGAYDYVSKPFNMEELVLIVSRALENRSLRQTVATDLQHKKKRFGLDSLVGASPQSATLHNMVRRLSESRHTSVLLLGETGTGKDMIARAIHYESPSASRPFMNITCTAMPESLIESELFGHEAGAFTSARNSKPGLFELANQGTVFLDEIGDMPSGLQAKLLRVLEDKAFRRVGGTRDIQVNCRIIAATNKDLLALMAQGIFREDLYYRLSTVPITLPPLRERQGDVMLLAEHFLAHYARKLGQLVRGFSPAASRALKSHGWPGNIRELRNVIERAVLFARGPEIQESDIVLGVPQQGHGGGFSQEAFRLPAQGCDLAEVERTLLEQALARTGGNQSQAAELLGITRDQVRYKLKKFGLEAIASP